jgi:hypothetical protein
MDLKQMPVNVPYDTKKEKAKENFILKAKGINRTGG